MESLVNSTPYSLSMSKEQFADLWVRNRSMVIYQVDGSAAIPAQNFKAKFAKARSITTSEAFVKSILSECNSENRIMADYINTHYERVVLGQ